MEGRKQLDPNKMRFVEEIIKNIDLMISHRSLPYEILLLEQPYREYFAELFCPRYAFTENKQLLFKLVISYPVPVINDSNAFYEFFNLVRDLEIDDCFKHLFELVRLGQILLTQNNLVLICHMITDIKKMKEIRINFSIHQEAIAEIKNQLDLNNCAYQIRQKHIDCNIAKQATFKASEPVSDSENLYEDLIKKSDMASTIKPKRDYTWLKWFAVGALIGLAIASIVVASVVTAGAVPAGLTLVTGIITAVFAGAGTSLLAGVVTAAIKKFNEIFSVKISISNKKQYEPVQTYFRERVGDLVYYYDQSDGFNSDDDNVIEALHKRLAAKGKAKEEKSKRKPGTDEEVLPPVDVPPAQGSKGKEEAFQDKNDINAGNRLPAPILPVIENNNKQAKVVDVTRYEDALQQLIQAVNYAIAIAPKNKHGMFQGQAPTPLCEIKIILQEMQAGTYLPTTALHRIASLAVGFGGKYHPIAIAANACLKMVSHDAKNQSAGMNIRNM